MEPLPVLAAACLLFTVGMFCSGLSDLRWMITAKSVENIQLLPFLATDAKYTGQPGLAGLRVPEAGPDADRRQQHRGGSAKPLHPGVLLLQHHKARGAAEGPGAPGPAGRGLWLLHLPDPRRGHTAELPGALLQHLHHRHVRLAAGRPGQGDPEQVDALLVLPPDRHHLPGLQQLDTVRAAALRPVHHGPQRAGHRHQRRAALAVLALRPGPGQALQTPARLRGSCRCRSPGARPVSDTW